MGVFSLLVPDPLHVGLPGAVGSGDGPRGGGHLAASISPWSSLIKAFAAASGEVFLK
jgi:hypothetical protein